MIIPFNKAPEEKIDQKSFLAGEQFVTNKIIGMFNDLLTEMDKTPENEFSKKGSIMLMIAMIGEKIIHEMREVTELYDKTGSVFKEDGDGD